MHVWREKEEFAQLSEALRPFIARLSVKHRGKVQWGEKGARILGEAVRQQLSWFPSDFWLSHSVCWHSSTPLTFSLTPYQNVFLSHTPLTLAPLAPPSHTILVQLFHLVVGFDINTGVLTPAQLGFMDSVFTLIAPISLLNIYHRMNEHVGGIIFRRRFIIC